MSINFGLTVSSVACCPEYRPVDAFSPVPAPGEAAHINLTGVSTMGKYLLGWIFGVPVIVLVIIYLLFN